MSQLDVLRSLLRSGARSAEQRLRASPLALAVRRFVSEAALGRVTVSDAQLTGAVARIPGVAAATVSSGQGKLRIDLGFADGSGLALALAPSGIAFAPGGAKELAFAVYPLEAASDPRGREVVAAIASELARQLWRPALARAPRSELAPSVSEHDGTWVVDLRSVPEVRWALRQRLPALVIEAIRPRSLEVDRGRIALSLTLDRL